MNKQEFEEIYRSVLAEQGILDRIVRISDVVQVTSLSKSRLWQLEKEGRFPKRIRLGHRTTGYRMSEVLDWLASPQDYQT